MHPPFARVFKLTVLLLLSVLAVGHDDHDHDHDLLGARANPSIPITVPTRPLTWGNVNIIHTTDTHGWLLGHQKATPPEPNYSGDLGDFASFVAHMKDIAILKGVDLIVVDTGDLHDGTGLSDGFPPGGIDGHDSNQFMKRLPFDVLTIGNHELSDGYNTAHDVFTDFAPFWNGRYLTSNVNITVYDKRHKPVSMPIGERFVKFKTRLGRSVTSLGILFDFTGNAENTTVQTVEDMVKERWFAEAIAEEPDFFLLIGHMPVSRDKWPVVFDAVRAVHPTTPILIFGGHSHVRDCLQFDGRSMSLESGRYMETIGWMSADLDFKRGEKKNITFTRRYLDQNRPTYEFHSGTSQRNFDTVGGISVTQGLNELSERFNLSFQFGTAPNDFFVDRAPFPSNTSLLSLFIQVAAPIALAINNQRASIPNIMITNSGSQRFDLFKGVFNRNDQFVASPFDDSFLFIEGVPLGVAVQVLPALNKDSSAKRRRAVSVDGEEDEEYRKGSVEKRFRAWLEEQARRAELEGLEKRQMENLTLGYATKDSCPGVGDDVPHAPLSFFSTPDFIGSNPPSNISTNSTNSSSTSSSPITTPTNDSTPIDLVFVDFIEDQVLEILNLVAQSSGLNKTFTDSDVSSYSPILANEVLGLFAEKEWN